MTGLLLRAHVIGIDSFPIEDKPPPQGHAYITWARLLKHGFTRGCSGCAMGHNRHSDECKARFDAIFSMRGEAVGPTPKPIADGEETEYEPSPPEPFPEEDVPECPPRSDDEADHAPALVTRQLRRSEVLSREDAIAAIKKEFDGIGAMGTWDLETVEEEETVQKRAIESGQTIHLADFLAICSEKHVAVSINSGMDRSAVIRTMDRECLRKVPEPYPFVRAHHSIQTVLILLLSPTCYYFSSCYCCC